MCRFTFRWTYRRCSHRFHQWTSCHQLRAICPIFLSTSLVLSICSMQCTWGTVGSSQGHWNQRRRHHRWLERRDSTRLLHLQHLLQGRQYWPRLCLSKQGLVRWWLTRTNFSMGMVFWYRRRARQHQWSSTKSCFLRSTSTRQSRSFCSKVNLWCSQNSTMMGYTCKSQGHQER